MIESVRWLLCWLLLPRGVVCGIDRVAAVGIIGVGAGRWAKVVEAVGLRRGDVRMPIDAGRNADPPSSEAKAWAREFRAMAPRGLRHDGIRGAGSLADELGRVLVGDGGRQVLQRGGDWSCCIDVRGCCVDRSRSDGLACEKSVLRVSFVVSGIKRSQANEHGWLGACKPARTEFIEVLLYPSCSIGEIAVDSAE
jgi:hypothetical protein